MTVITESALDAILAVQFLVAWAGEGRCDPTRLGWWESDLVDEAGGGDLFARLTPRTAAWASLEAAREAARRTDAKARAKMADPDKMRSIFFLGFEIDEQVSDRLAALKRRGGELAAKGNGGGKPADVLPLPFALGSDFSKEKLTDVLRGFGDGSHIVVPGGRQLKHAMPTATDELVRQLAAGLVPLADTYPLPFFKLDR